MAQRDAHVLDRVVAVDMQVAIGLDLEVDQAVAGHLVEHVVEEPDAGGQPGITPCRRGLILARGCGSRRLRVILAALRRWARLAWFNQRS
jgi:hypothetical protein